MPLSLSLSEFFDFSSYKHRDFLFSIDCPWKILTQISSYIQTLKLGIHLGTISQDAYLIHPELISIGEGSIVEPGAYIEGPCFIGEKCVIRHGAYIRGNFLTGDRCIIGHDTEVKNTVFLDGAHAAHFAYVGDSVLGNYVNLGAGTKCANFRLDKSEIRVSWLNQRISTGLRKMGAFIGDGSQIGCNVVLNPGTLIGKEVLCHPSLNIGGSIPKKSLVRSPLVPQIVPY